MGGKWRVLVCLVAALELAVAPVTAEHSPHFDVDCPTGSADVVLDPGHGGSDPGAVRSGPELVERDLVLDIALDAAKIIERETGMNVALTRTDNETDLGNSERGEIANACGALVFVEIHLNSAADVSINRAQAFWGEKEKDLALAVMMSDALAPLGLPVADVDRFDNGGLLRARMPSVLVEPAFLSNQDEARELSNGDRKDEISRAIADGVIDWLAFINESSASMRGSELR
jgi:N-acetylmuramoyl-L-alanine amidase